MEVKAYRVAQRFDYRHEATDREASRQQVGHGEGDTEVHDGERNRLEHGRSPDENHCG